MLIRKTVMSLLAPFVFFFAVHCEAQELGKTLWIDQNKDLKVKTHLKSIGESDGFKKFKLNLQVESKDRHDFEKLRIKAYFPDKTVKWAQSSSVKGSSSVTFGEKEDGATVWTVKDFESGPTPSSFVINFAIPADQDPILSVYASASKSIRAVGSAVTTVQTSTKDGYYGIDILYGTNRERVKRHGKMRYTGLDARRLEFGRSETTIPFRERTKNPLYPNDPTRTFQMNSVTRSKAQWQTELAKQIQRIKNDREFSGTFVYVHGYNVEFEQAVERLARLGLDFPGLAPVLFSWPSNGTVKDYVTDLADADQSAKYFVDFLKTLAAKTDSSKIHVVAHSMGNRVLVKALNMIATDNELKPAEKLKLGHIVMIAADIDVRELDQEAIDRWRDNCGSLTLYASTRDKVLQTRDTLFGHEYKRAGQGGDFLLVRKHLESIDTSSCKMAWYELGHSYHRSQGMVIADLYSLLTNGHPATERFLDRFSKDDQTVFSIKKCGHS